MKKEIKEIAVNIFWTVLIAFVLLKFVILPCKVDGTSMYPTLNPDDFGYSFICSKYFGIDRFDVVVIDIDDKLLVKRVIGLPNDTVEYKDNRLYINGEYYEEEFVVDNYTEDFKVELKDDEYYCLGDNRRVSLDSRYYGSFSKDQIKSLHVLVVYPFCNFGFN